MKTSLRILRAVKRDAFSAVCFLPSGRNISETAAFSKVFKENNPATAPFYHNPTIETRNRRLVWWNL
ncbi:hypothetical protein ACLJYM_02660 [Rhizobium giardinii]|uniref:hypothetical protein n=1 Tax=Rhizobium giardinii TaxID=56731 RepID=UPI0039E1E6D3